MDNNLTLHQVLAEFKRLGYYGTEYLETPLRYHICGSVSFKIYLQDPLTCYFHEKNMSFVIRNIDKFKYVDSHYLSGRGKVYQIKTSDLLEILRDDHL